jgi:hypothetical protein
MPEADTSSRPYNPEAATSKQEIRTIKFQIYQLEERIEEQTDPKVRYNMLKQAALLLYAMTPGIKPMTGKEKDFTTDMTEIEEIYKRVANDKLPTPPTPQIEPLQFRQGLPQYEVFVGDQSVMRCFGGQNGDLKTVTEILMNNERDLYSTEGCNRMLKEWAKLHWYLAKYRIWHLDTRIYMVETGYDAAKRKERLLEMQSAAGESANPSEEGEDEDFEP